MKLSDHPTRPKGNSVKIIKVVRAATLGVGVIGAMMSFGLSAAHADPPPAPGVVCIGQHMWPNWPGYIDPSCNNWRVSDRDYNLIMWSHGVQGAMDPWRWDMLHHHHDHDDYDAGYYH